MDDAEVLQDLLLENVSEEANEGSNKFKPIILQWSHIQSGLVIFWSTESKEFEEYVTSDALPKEFDKITNELENPT